jgi:hypothetical protein
MPYNLSGVRYLDVLCLGLEFPELALLEGDELGVQLLGRVALQAGQRDVHTALRHPRAEAIRSSVLRIRIPTRISRIHVFGPLGSESGSISQRYGSGSLYHQRKIVRKTLIPTVLWLLFDFLSLKRM